MKQVQVILVVIGLVLVGVVFSTPAQEANIDHSSFAALVAIHDQVSAEMSLQYADQ